MRKWHYYAIGATIIAVFLGIVKFIIGSKVLDVVDIYVPYYNSSQYYQSFFGIWKVSDAGGSGSSPISMLYSAILSSLGVPYQSMQFAMLSILVFSEYSSLFVLMSYIADENHKLSLLLTFILLFLEFKWTGLLGATGLNFFLAFSPFLIYFFLRMFRSEISPLRSMTFISLSFVGASFEITEAFPYSLFIYCPILIMAIIQYLIGEHNLKSLNILMQKQLIFLGGVFVGLIILIYPYYPWILASLGVGSNSPESLKSTYFGTNIFIANSFASLGSGASILGADFGLSGSFASVFGFVLIFVLGAYVIKRRSEIHTLAAFVFIIFLVIYIQLAISLPIQLFHFITSIPFLGELLITLNEPAQSYYIVAVWVYFIVGVAFFDMIRNYKVLSKFLKSEIFKNENMSINRNAGIKLKSKTILQIVMTVFTVILFLSTLISTSSVANGSASYTPFGDYDIQNYIPNYVHSIYETSANNSINGPQKILLLPDYPRVERWEQTSPLFFTFPPSNSWQMSSFKSFINDIQNHIEAGTGEMLGQMDIGYVVVVKALNQSETGPVIGYDNFHQPYGIFGNPTTFYNYFNNSPDFRLVSNNGNYSMFKNLNNTGLFKIYSGLAYVNDTPQVFVVNNTSNSQILPKNGFILSSNISSVNMLNKLIQSNYWTTFGKNISEEFLNSTLLVNFSSFSAGYHSIYMISGFPVSPGMELEFSSQIRALNNSSAIYYNGFDIAYSNEAIESGHFWNNGIYSVQGNVTINASGLFTIPENVTYIDPWITLYNATGSFVISNLSINVVKIGNNSSFPFAYVTSQGEATFSTQGMENEVQSSFPHFDFVFVNRSYIPSLSSIYVSIYKNSTSYPGLYIVPYFYLADKYGYVWGTKNYSMLNPGSYEIGNLSLKDGFYHIDIKIRGFGLGSFQLNNKSYIYNTLANGAFAIGVNISVGKILHLQIHNVLGVVELYDIILIGPNLSNELDNMLRGTLTEPSYSLNPGGNPSHILLNLYANKSIFIVLKESFSDHWSVSYDASNKEHTEKPILANGYQMMFILPSNSSNISFIYRPPLNMNIQVGMTVVLLPTFICIALVMTIFDIKRRL